jgi:hypothetical protein
MARIIHDLKAWGEGRYRLYTDLDFWDARKILRNLATARRNFGESPSGDQYPTQVMVDDPSPQVRREVEKRLLRAIPSPPRHVIVQSIVLSGRFSFPWRRYYPARWSPSRALFFTRNRLPLNQPVISSRYRWVELAMVGETIVIEQRQGIPPRDAARGDKRRKPEPWGPSCV